MRAKKSNPKLTMGCSPHINKINPASSRCQVVADQGVNYRGNQNTTISGLTCQRWSSTVPHSHGVSPKNYADRGIGDHNYCRNFNGQPGRVWCYTTDPKVRSE